MYGILRPDLFDPKSVEGWHNCVNEDYKTSPITNLDYAKKILERYDNPSLIGVDIELEEGYVPKEGLLGFDIIDGHSGVSLITNWGTDEEGINNNHIMNNGLIGDLGRLGDSWFTWKNFPEDSHAENFKVWTIYRVDA